jgi:hypothetical protein
MPAASCSRVESAVNSPRIAALPASSGCSRSSVSCSLTSARSIAATMAACNAPMLAKGLSAALRSATHGECSKTPRSAATKASRSIRFKSPSGTMLPSC